jgi:hypothetical protein
MKKPKTTVLCTSRADILRVMDKVSPLTGAIAPKVLKPSPSQSHSVLHQRKRPKGR